MSRLLVAVLLAGGLDAGKPPAPPTRPGAEVPGAGHAERSSASTDGGVAQHLRLTAEDCDALVEVLILISVNDSLEHSAEYQALEAGERLAAKKEVQRRALADSRLAALKRDCPVRYSRRQADCIHLAKSMDEVDACPR